MNTKVKAVIAVICLAAAGVLLAMNFGLIGGGKPKPAAGTQQTQGTTGGSTGSDPAKTGESETAGQLRKERN
jgi:hypothetical protein